mmetsp:Transcript_29947/g.39373  ORF Transcript_29947/g.39373 Transcript_29947/m.39373 type:complete len:121 (-) Transcript_29947:132-494(-)|eukprot:CAMPEP_0117752036 /NCGR_PEP_ID=MMETSP0947-20121206/11364_1 /TAXON_ID=44440 /ORGANISM="Chattonella subsalsa, Strain CCMP2191" /LENGTH=120 /DNA_ID=CAMNT_0005570597 /DNA_START=169 /DNA_END=531 /DNA_ORIENTATION=+
MAKQTSHGDIYDFPQLQDAAGGVAQRALTNVLEGRRFQSAKLNEWTDQITQECITELRKLSCAFKFAVSCLIFQKETEDGGGALTSSVAAYWDPKTDGAFSLRWENDSISCLLVISGYAL